MTENTKPIGYGYFSNEQGVTVWFFDETLSRPHTEQMIGIINESASMLIRDHPKKIIINHGKISIYLTRQPDGGYLIASPQ